MALETGKSMKGPALHLQMEDVYQDIHLNADRGHVCTDTGRRSPLTVKHTHHTPMYANRILTFCSAKMVLYKEKRNTILKRTDNIRTTKPLAKS